MTEANKIAKIAKIKKIIKRCKQSPAYFIDNFCKIKHPNAGILPFQLFSYQRSCLDKFKKHRFNVFSKTRQCFAAGTPVWTPSGPCPIEKLKIGDLVYTYNTEKCCLEIAPVSNTFENNTRDTVIVRTKSGHRARVTPDHKYLTTNGWVEAQNLTQNDIVIEINDLQRYFHAERSDAIILGYLITDGYYGSQNRGIHFTNTTWKYLLEYQKHFELKFGKKLPIKKHDWNNARRKKDAYRICAYSKEMKAWLSDLEILGHKSATKIIPEVVFSWDNESIAILLNRMFAGDGWYSGAGKNASNEAGIGSLSILMLCQIKQLLTRFNIDSKVYPATKSGIAKLRIIGGRDFNNFVNYVGINGKDPRRPLTQGFIKNRVKGKILSVEPSNPTEVYDIEVPPHNNFVVDGVVVHNSGVSTLCGAYALWLTMFFKTKTVLIVSKRDKDAMVFMERNIKFVYNYLPQWMKSIWATTTNNEHEIGFANGSKITSLPSGPDTLRSNSSSLNIIDEAAFCPHMSDMWCLSPDTLISTPNGIKELKEIEKNEKVKSIDGTNTCLKTYHKKSVNVSHITTSSGHYVVAGLNHMFKDDLNNWISVKDMAIGTKLKLLCNWTKEADFIKLRNNTYDNFIDTSNLKNSENIKVNCRCGLGKEIKVRSLRKKFKGKSGNWHCNSCVQTKKLNMNLPTHLDSDLAKFIGLYVGDGSCSKKRPRRISISTSHSDTDIINFIKQLYNKWNIKVEDSRGQKYYNTRIDSSELIKLLDKNGLLNKINATPATIPKYIFKSGRSVHRAFLCGLFSSDGSISDTPKIGDCRPVLSTASKKLAEQVQILLLGLGIYSNILQITNAKGRFSKNVSYKITISDKTSKSQFSSQIGFIQKRKQSITNRNLIDCAEHDHRIVTVKNMHSDIIDVNDISVTGDNSYISNGFISHNSGGYPTLQHGGSIVVVSTSHGIGDWYWKTWTDAQDLRNEFNPVQIDWWDMDWAIEYKDDITGNITRIAPTDNMRKCNGKDEITKYGEYWSPWLETQYKQLTEKGNDSKFRQEVLRDFLGSGNTVLSRDTLIMMRAQAKNAGQSYKTVNHVDYVQPIISESYHLDFQDRLWIWKEPKKDHLYVMGADISSGEAADWSAVQIFDIMMGEQVAELQIKSKPKVFSIMIDYLGRWYNNAFLVPERTGMGVTVCQDLEEFAYPSIFRKGMLPSASKKPLSSQNQGPIGYNTTGVGKPILDKSMIDNFGENGYKINSHRLVMQAETYVHLGANKTGAEKGTMNDDLVIAAGLAFVAINLAIGRGNSNLIPFNANVSFGKPGEQTELVVTNDFTAVSPIVSGKSPMPGQTQEEEMIRFAQTLMMPIVDSQMPAVRKKRKLL